MRVMKHAAGGCEAAGLMRENLDLGFGEGAAVGSGFMGMILENADFGADSNARRPPIPI
jgi:hypothetical protein